MKVYSVPVTFNLEAMDEYAAKHTIKVLLDLLSEVNHPAVEMIVSEQVHLGRIVRNEIEELLDAG